MRFICHAAVSRQGTAAFIKAPSKNKGASVAKPGRVIKLA